MNKIKFGTGGWRARIGEDFTKANVYAVASAIATMIFENKERDKPVVIGYDNRFLSNEAAVWVTEMLATHGIKVIYFNTPVPTPLVMHYVKEFDLHYGIEITASHNPYNYNGIKLFTKEGRDASIEVTKREEELIQKPNGKIYAMSFPMAYDKGWVEVVSNPWVRFVSSITSQLNIATMKQAGLRILVDPMHGSGLVPLQMVLAAAGCQVDVINGNKDAYFGYRLPAPTQDTLKELSMKVVEGGYDLGIALDGDGDRLGIIDSNGRYIDANDILCLLYYYLVAFKGWKGSVVRNYATTHRLDKIATTLREKCYEVPIGFKHISAGMDKYNAVLGGESSGGLTVKGHIHGKDSIYAAALFVEMVCETKTTPSDMIESLTAIFGRSTMVEANLELADKKAVAQKISSKKHYPSFDVPVKKVEDADGLKVYFENGDWVICRLSGTEPVLRIFAEADTKENAQKYIDAYKAYLKLN